MPLNENFPSSSEDSTFTIELSDKEYNITFENRIGEDSSSWTMPSIDNWAERFIDKRIKRRSISLFIIEFCSKIKCSKLKLILTLQVFIVLVN